ncbi:MAG: DsbA family protein [Pseudomonadota bacterium]
MILTRRTFSALMSMTGVSALLGLSPFSLIGDASAQTAAEIATPSPLGDMALGPENASVTIIEYASMTCPHCANFTHNVFPKIKSEYIDTGKVRFIFREFPLDEVAAAGSIVARCIAKDNSQMYFALVDAMFKQQNDLARTPLPTLKRIGKQAGLSEEAVEACLDKKTETGKRLLDGIVQTLDYANTKLKVNSTPFFFVNGTPLKGDTSFEAFDKMIKPLLKS